MSNLQAVIEKTANDFAKSIIDAVKQSSLQELLALQGGTAPVVAGAKKRGRPPKTTARKRGRPPKAVAKPKTKKTAKKAVKAPAKKKRKINYPKCSVPGCGKNRWARGNGMCGEHYKASLSS
ncbi:MAG: hypothetical protein WC931_05160 [Bacilli bacterium]|jgi:hypothetical protein